MNKFFPLLALTVLIFSSERIHAQMTVHYIDVGQGEAILIELPKAAIMIDAGGEDTGDSRFRDHLLDYLARVFERRRELNNTIDVLIVTHPHLDHTRYLPDVMKMFNVKALVDGGNRTGSGITPLDQARQTMLAQKARYVTARESNSKIIDYNNVFNGIRASDPDVTLRLLNGARDCDDANNDSLVLWLSYRGKTFLFTGDAPSVSDKKCRDEISMLLDRYQSSGYLKANVLKVNFHGSASGVTDEWMKAISPRVSIISAGRSDEQFRFSGQFHAWQFGLPRESAVRIVQGRTYGVRTKTRTVTMMRAVQVQSKPALMTAAVYCTCWDGDISVKTDGRSLNVETARKDD
jgi:beta-lactamase superfamily II metal-dependent hydrolase